MHGFDLLVVLANPDFARILWAGALISLVVAAGSWCLAMGIALALLAIRLSPSWIGDRLAAAYISYHRNVPTLVQLMLWYFGIASLMPDAVQSWLNDHGAETIYGILGLGLCQAAYFSEDLRSGLRAVPAGQMEAARALGHGFLGALRHVLMPQAVRNALPGLINHSVSLFKNSSLAMAIGVSELTHAVKEVENLSFRTFETYLIATLAYLAVSFVIMAVGATLQWRTQVAGVR